MLWGMEAINDQEVLKSSTLPLHSVCTTNCPLHFPFFAQAALPSTLCKCASTWSWLMLPANVTKINDNQRRVSQSAKGEGFICTQSSQDHRIAYSSKGPPIVSTVYERRGAAAAASTCSRIKRKNSTFIGSEGKGSGRALLVSTE